MAQRHSRCSAGSRPLALFPRSQRPTIPLADDHPLVVLTDTVDWTEMEARAQQLRTKKLKHAAGRPPHLRATLGALAFMAIRYRPYRDEGSIGTIKRQRYGFNRPAAQSVAMMGVGGQRAVLGFNLGKLVRGIAQKRRLEVVW